jgi:opacity protein-like surface antigen
MISMNRSAAATLVALGCTAALPVAAQSTPAKPDEWAFRATLYGWFPAIGGSTAFPVSTGGTSLNVDADDVLDSLKMAFMGTFEFQRGQWGGLVDWVYADLGADKSGTRNFRINGQPLAAGINANLSLDIKTNILTLAGTYSLVENPESTMAVVFGARMLDMEQTLNWSFNGIGPIGIARVGTSEVSETVWDGVVGLKGRVRFGDERRWYLPYYADIGTGDSKLTWQAVLGLGYSFSWGDLAVAWRYLDYDFDDGSKVESLTFNGVAIGVSFRF